MSLLLWATTYVALDYVGLLTVLPEFGIALFFPAAGLAAAWILLTPVSRAGWVVSIVLVATTLVAMTDGIAPLAALLYGLAHAGQVWLLHLVLRGRRPGAAGDRPAYVMTSPSQFLSLGVAAVVATVATAPLGTIAAAALTGQWDWLVPVSWSVRNSSSIVVVASAVIVLRRHLLGRGSDADVPAPVGTSRTRLERGFLLLLGAAGAVLVFATSLGLPSVFVVVVATAWGAYRFGPPVAALACLGLSSLTLAAATLGGGPFAGIDNALLQAGFVQTFCGLCAVLAMLLALGSAEQQRLTGALTQEAGRAQERLQLFESLSASTTDAVVVVDADDRVVWANESAGRLLLRADSLAEWALTDLDGLALEHDRLPHRRALAGSVVTHERVVRPSPTPGGQRIVLSVSANGLSGFENHTSPTVVMVLRDVTTDEDHRQQLQEFAGVVAHDLRGPLTSVSGWTEAALDELTELQERPDSAVRATDLALVRNALDRVAGRAAHMSVLIEDLLRHAQAHDGSLLIVEIDTEALVAEVAEHHGARTRVHVEGVLPVMRGDRGLLGQVIGNLVANALKYVEPGAEARIEVTGRLDTASTTLEVHDNGIGIPPDQLSLIWAPFHRAHAGYPGTGLGLAICRAIVERHGGRIEARPRAAGGTTFEVTLPR